jgi:kinesin family protein 3/17
VKKNKTVVDMRKVLQLEDEKKKAEEDKIAAIKALEEKSREFLHEKENKKILENKIAAMQSQLLVGGQRVEDTPQFKNAVEAQQKAIRQE